jgi:hypothetical protein
VISPVSVNETQMGLMKNQDIRLWSGEFEEDDIDEGINDEE